MKRTYLKTTKEDEELMKQKKCFVGLLSLCLLLTALSTATFASTDSEGYPPFLDVYESDHYYDAALWAVEQGITTCTTESTFSPDGPCTRGQIVTSLFRDREDHTASTVEAHSAADDGLGYWLYTPSDPAEQMPLIVYLHGGSGKGSDLNLITSMDGFPQYLQTGALGDVSAYVLIPQLPSAQKGWAEADDSLYRLIQTTVSELDIDTGNISLTGHSMGGTGTWNLAAKYPALFARIAPLSGSAKGTADTVESLHNTSIWAFVGSADTIVPPDSSAEMVAELEEAGGAARITVLDGADHFAVPALTYLDEGIDLIGWLIGETK